MLKTSLYAAGCERRMRFCGYRRLLQVARIHRPLVIFVAEPICGLASGSAPDGIWQDKDRYERNPGRTLGAITAGMVGGLAEGWDEAGCISLGGWADQRKGGVGVPV